MDRSSLIGFSLMIACLFGYLYFSQKQGEYLRQQKIQDSIATAKNNPPLNNNDTANFNTSGAVDTNQVQQQQTYVLQNKDLKVTFTNKGAQIVQAELANYKSALPLKNRPNARIFIEGKNEMDLNYKSQAGSIVHSKELMFSAVQNGNKITFTNDQGLQVEYTLPEQGYAIDIKYNAANLASGANMNMSWQTTAPNNEYRAEDELQYTQLVYNDVRDGVDYSTITGAKDFKFKNDIKWICCKQHYFNATLINKNGNFKQVVSLAKPTEDTSNATVANFTNSFELGQGTSANLTLFAGPNDYDLLKAQGNGMQEIIPYGYGFLSFVKYINKWFMLPIFNTLSKFIKNWGIVIMLLTIIVRLVTSPLIYKSYLSGAKMKVLKPELDKLKEKHGDDQQAYMMESMALQRSAGVSPLGGCLPALLQLPIFFALLSLFPNALQLRQQGFLWAKDLSTFDSIANIPNIPFYGSHISLWTLIFVATQLILALSSMNLSAGADQNNPALKYLPFIMPIMFLGIFNKLPASLTFYYCVSNVITIILQWVIQNFIINQDKLRAQLAENMSKKPKPGGLMEKLMEAQKQKMELERSRQQRRNS